MNNKIDATELYSPSEIEELRKASRLLRNVHREQLESRDAADWERYILEQVSWGRRELEVRRSIELEFGYRKPMNWQTI